MLDNKACILCMHTHTHAVDIVWCNMLLDVYWLSFVIGVPVPIQCGNKFDIMHHVEM